MQFQHPDHRRRAFDFGRIWWPFSWPTWTSFPVHIFDHLCIGGRQLATPISLIDNFRTLFSILPHRTFHFNLLRDEKSLLEIEIWLFSFFRTCSNAVYAIDSMCKWNLMPKCMQQRHDSSTKVSTTFQIIVWLEQLMAFGCSVLSLPAASRTHVFFDTPARLYTGLPVLHQAKT